MLASWAVAFCCRRNRLKIFSATVFLILWAMAAGLPPDAFAAPPVPTGEVQFFVDAGKGNDANSGESAAKALKSLWAAQKLMEKVPADKRVILNLARGSVWREDVEAANMADYQRKVIWGGGRTLLTIRDYGQGDKPTISGFDLL
ncbi:MAG: hypothetical protein Q8O57_14040, partial [Kiritimatiellota bacterium]|nr:hypothetical protein [Kiritimatiellota bacterium]